MTHVFLSYDIRKRLRRWTTFIVPLWCILSLLEIDSHCKRSLYGTKKRKLDSWQNWYFWLDKNPLKHTLKHFLIPRHVLATLKTLLFLAQKSDYVNDERLHLIFIQSPLIFLHAWQIALLRVWKEERHSKLQLSTEKLLFSSLTFLSEIIKWLFLYF